MESLSRIYSQHHKSNRGRNFVFYEKERSEFITNTTGSGKKILDIGCRDGALTKYAIANGNIITGCDIDTDSLDYAKKLGIETVYMDLNGDWNELHDQKYEMAMAFEIIEHLYFPEKVLEKIKAHLHNNGTLIGSIPNAFNWRSRLLLLFGKKNGTSFSDPTHINHFSYNEFHAILNKHFHDVKIYPLTTRNRVFLSKISTNLFSAGFLFKCTNPK